MEQLLLRADEAAQALGVSRSKVYELVAAGQLPGVRIGRSVRIPAAALRRMAAEEERSAPTGV